MTGYPKSEYAEINSLNEAIRVAHEYICKKTKQTSLSAWLARPVLLYTSGGRARPYVLHTRSGIRTFGSFEKAALAAWSDHKRRQEAWFAEAGIDPVFAVRAL